MRSIQRRDLSSAGLAILAGASLAGTASAQSSAPKNRVVIQVSDNDPAKWQLVLNNAGSIHAALGGAASLEMEMVAFGPGIAMVKRGSPAEPRIAAALKAGTRIVACENTMRGLKLTSADMLPDIGYVPSGVVELMRKQQEGYSYLRP